MTLQANHFSLNWRSNGLTTDTDFDVSGGSTLSNMFLLHVDQDDEIKVGVASTGGSAEKDFDTVMVVFTIWPLTQRDGRVHHLTSDLLQLAHVKPP